MKRGSSGMILLALCIATVFVSAAEGAFEGAYVDPFREGLVVGRYSDPDHIEMDGVWPRDLFAPPTADPAWREARLQYFPGHRQRTDGLACRRLLRSALGGETAAREWLEDREELLRELLNPQLIQVKDLRDEDDDRLEVLALTLWQSGDYASAASISGRAAVAAAAAGDVIGSLLMSVRRRAAEAMAATGGADMAPTAAANPAPAVDEFWTELLALRAADARIGWALWTAHRRAAGSPLLPPGCGSDELARWLISLPNLKLDIDEVKAAGFPAEAETAVSLYSQRRLISSNPTIRDYLAERPMPLGDTAFQWIWLISRRDAYIDDTKVPVGELARREGIRDANRSRLLSLKADRDFQKGRLDEALELLALGRGRGSQGPLAVQYHRGAMLALADRDSGTAARVVAAARENLAEDVWAPFAAKLELIHGAGPKTATLLEQAEFRVRLGEAEPLRTQTKPRLRSRLATARHQARDAWLEWGRTLAERIGDDPRLTAAETDFLAAIAKAAKARTQRARFGIGCDALGKWMAGSPHRGKLLDWCLTRDLERLAGPLHAAVSSPLPAIARSEAGTGNGEVSRLALCGLGLALGDGRGQIAATAGFAIAEVDERQRFLLTHPLPNDVPVVDELDAAGLETALILAVARRESLFDPGIRSRAGALGLMQIMPFHYEDRGFSAGVPFWRQPVRSLRKGVSLLLENAERFDHDPYRTLVGYNAGPTAARRWAKEIGPAADNSHFLVWAGYSETSRYMEQVLIDRTIYDWILNGWPEAE